LQEANIEVKNVAEWIEELDEFFKRQREAEAGQVLQARYFFFDFKNI
jgi:hypothetical protein